MSSTALKFTSTNVKVAVVQTASVAFDLEACLVKLEEFTKNAAANGAELILFPEAFVSAYPRANIFGAMPDNFFGEVDNVGREKYRRYWESSIDIPGPAIDRISGIAKTNRVYLVVGVIEREHGTLYCCVIHFDNEGTFLGKRRKLVPTFHERMVWGRGDGSTLPVYNTPIGKIGSVICWENYMPMLRLSLYEKGIQIYLAPTADDCEAWISTMRHIALEGRCFVLGCNQFAKKSDYPKGYVESGNENLDDFIMSRGGSCIVNPMGKLLAGPLFDAEGILYADIDLGDCLRGKLDLDVVGHYSRPDVFTLNVNTTEQKNIVIAPSSKSQDHDHLHSQQK